MRWSATTNIIHVTVRHYCLPNLGFLTSGYMQAQMRAAGYVDSAGFRVVGRGDSPGCVTRTEYNSVARGMTKARVHQIFDADGRLVAARAGFRSRAYRICGVGEGVYVEYPRGATAWRVANKFWTDD